MNDLFLILVLCLLNSCTCLDHQDNKTIAHRPPPGWGWYATITARNYEDKGVLENSRDRMARMALECLMGMFRLMFGHPPKTIYGRLLDQHGAPVAGAWLEFWCDGWRLHVHSNQNGEYSCRVPWSIDSPQLKEIRCYGYEWRGTEDCRREYDLSSYHPEKVYEQWYSTTRKNRHVNMLRKKVHPTYLVPTGWNARFGLNGNRPDGYFNYLGSRSAYSPDRRELFYEDQLARGVPEETLAYDLWFHAERRADGGGWDLRVTPNGEGAGVILWKGGEIHEAPEDGYQPSLTLPIDDGREERFTLCTRTRRFPLYAVLHLVAYASDAEQTRGEKGPWLNVKGEEQAGFYNPFPFGKYNPFGKRSLEKDEALERESFPSTPEGDKEWKRVKKHCETFTERLRQNILPDESELDSLRHIPDYAPQSH